MAGGRKRGISAGSFYGPATKRSRTAAANAVSAAASSVVRSVLKKGIQRFRARKTKMKGSGSRTMTKTEKKRKQDVNLDLQGLHKRDLGLVVLGKKVKHEKLLGTYQYRNINQWVIQGLQGHQVADFAEVMMTRPQVLGASLSSNRGERYRWADNPYQLNPFSEVPTSLLYSGTSTPASDLLYIKTLKTVTHMLNMTKIPMNVDVYWLTSKYDTSDNPIDTWTNILNDKSIGQSTQVGATATTTASATAGTALRIDYGANPFHHVEFAKVWKCVKSSHVIAQAGEQVDLYLDFQVEKIISRATLLSSRKQDFLKGITVFPIFIARCGLEGIATAEGAAASEVAYGQVKLGVVSNQLYTFGALPQSRISTARTYTGTIVSTTQVEKTIDDDDDIVLVKPDL